MQETDGENSKRYSREELTDDVRWLAETLEDAHPDPYSGHGGRVHFHRRVEELIRNLPSEDESIANFYPRVAELVALVRDGHTGIYSPGIGESTESEQLPLEFLVVGGELYVEKVYDSSVENLLGGRLVSVDGIPTPELTDRMSRLKGGDNVFQDRVSLKLALRDISPLRYLLDEPSHTLNIIVELPNGATTEGEIVPIAGDEQDTSPEPIAELESSIQLPETSGEPAYRFLDENRMTALLVLPDMISYREAHEVIRSLGYERGEEIAQRVYQDLFDTDVPDTYNEIVGELPSAIHILTEMVEEMERASTEHLIVDTRQNTGGNSLLSNALTYVLFGWEGIEATGENHIEIPKDSELYRKQVGEDGPVESPNNPAGFDFSSYFDRNNTDERIGRLREWLERSPTFAAELDSEEFEALYCPPSVSVVTDATTYSAGAEPAFGLSQLGATVVGVPPSQAPNVPRDMLKASLPNTELEMKTAYRHVESRPEIEGRVFEPDIELTPERFEEMSRTADAGVRLALEKGSD